MILRVALHRWYITIPSVLLSFVIAGTVFGSMDQRYSGFTGKLRWVKDKFASLPREVNVFYEQARQGYVNRMQQVISNVADTIDAELIRAKQRIATGRAELQAEVKKLPADLQAIGKQAATCRTDRRLPTP